MAEPARRNTRTEGSDIVRRLLARPIRLEQDRYDTRPTRRTTPPADDPGPAAVADPDLDAEDALDRAEAELTLVKAVLQAERRETASLRARLDRIAEGATFDDDAEAVRARWSRLVDTLLRGPH